MIKREYHDNFADEEQSSGEDGEDKFPTIHSVTGIGAYFVLDWCMIKTVRKNEQFPAFLLINYIFVDNNAL